jgi:zinc transport system permease protein
MPDVWMAEFVRAVADGLDVPLFMVKGVIAVVHVCLLCGAVGSMVVGNRMAFFSDAMAHSAFAGVTIGYLSVIAAGAGRDAAAAAWVVPLVMVSFGALVGAAMVYVRERTGLTHDTVIGVFFALAIGLGAMLFRVLQEKAPFNPESFLFGSLVFVPEISLVYLLVLVLLVGGLFVWRYNDLTFASFSPSLARTRRVGLRANNYLFIVLLALVVNLSITAVGALLINALLVVPGAAAANVARNLRQMFWLTLAFCLGSGLVGFYLSTVVTLPVGGGVKFGPSGTIVVVSVAVFFVTVLLSGLKNRPAPR